jgi:hypothetical protein
MIAEPLEDNISPATFSSQWNNIVNQFIETYQPGYIDRSSSSLGHPVIKVSDTESVQVDFMWHTPQLSKWGETRVTPQHGVKGLLMGNLFSVLGELLDMSIQHAGVQLKVVDQQHVPFSKQKNTKIITVSINPETFVKDIFDYEADQLGLPGQANNLLKRHAGVNPESVKIEDLVRAIQGLATSAEASGMMGQGDFARYSSAADFLDQFWQRYEAKALKDISGTKRDKAETEMARARAERDRQKITNGLEMVKNLFIKQSISEDATTEKLTAAQQIQQRLGWTSQQYDAYKKGIAQNETGGQRDPLKAKSSG